MNLAGALSWKDQRWRDARLAELPAEVARFAAERYTLTAQSPRTDYGAGSFSSVARANLQLGDTARELRGVKFDLVESEHAIRERAETLARWCAWAGSLDGMRRIARTQGVEPPASKHMTRIGELSRLTCPRWWRRRLRAALGQRAENALRAAGYVRKGRAPYVSDFSLRRRRSQRARCRAMLEDAKIENETGEQLELFPIVEKSISNPRIRRGEFMVRIRGFEEIAEECGHAATFVTLTAPSAFHPQLAAGGENPRFDRANCAEVRAARAWLARMWARVRAKLARLSVLYYGFRIAEPHHDGTPHWHLLLFGTAAALETIERVIRGVWLSEYASEPGAAEHRAKFKAIEPGQGTAAGYCAKYVAKNIDGHEVGQDTEAGTSGEEGAARVDAWAATHRIRQFQQLGGPPVGLWRELRRLREPVAAGAIEAARAAADAGDWSGFIRAAGGIEAGRRGPVRVWTEQTGELTGYGEVRPAVPAGVTAGGERVRTRNHVWRVRWGAVRASPGGAGRERSLSALGPVAITVRGAPAPSGGQERPRAAGERRQRRPRAGPGARAAPA